MGYTREELENKTMEELDAIWARLEEERLKEKKIIAIMERERDYVYKGAPRVP